MVKVAKEWQEMVEANIKKVERIRLKAKKEVFKDLKKFEQIMKSVNQPRLVIDWMNYGGIKKKHLKT
jgi:hypothetical protein